MDDKEQAIHKFWSSFGWTAYDENTVPDGAILPYITYNVGVGNYDVSISLTASLWSRSSSWAEVTRKLHEIERAFGLNGVMLKIDSGYIWLRRGNTPFGQRGSDENSSIRRIIITYEAEFLSAY